MKNLSTSVFLFPGLILAVSGCGNSDAARSAAEISMPERAAAAHEVTQAFGPLVVREGEFDEAAARMPWSGSWLPLKSKELFQSDQGLSPLEKYDVYMDRVHGQKMTAADTERNDPLLYDPNSLGWEGRCDAWAAASIIEDEPTRPVEVSGITFTVGDLKELLTKTYESNHCLRQFGKNFGPGPDADFNQIYPDQFHRAIQHEIFEHHRLLVYDNDPTEQVWNTPAYRAMFEIKPDTHDAQLMHVTAYLWGVSPFIPNRDYVGTLTVNYIYTYDLYGIPQNDGSFRVAFGEWTGDSSSEHPNFVSVLTGDLRHSSNNTEIDTNVVNEIIAQSRGQTAL